MGPIRLDRDEARRIAVRAQLLDARRPGDLLEVVNRLTFLQLDPTAAVAPSADLVAWTRLGAAYEPAHLQRALDRDRTLFEYRATARPMADLGLYRAQMERAPQYQRPREWLAANASFREDVLRLLADSGPLPSRDVPDTSSVPWPSTGWTNNRNTTQMLEILAARGEVAIAGRQGKQRLWDLAERVYPSGLVVLPFEAAVRERNARRLKALGIARASTVAEPVEPADVGDAGEAALVEGTTGEWRVDPESLDRPFTGRTALLSPFDRLVHDRRRGRRARVLGLLARPDARSLIARRRAATTRRARPSPVPSAAWRSCTGPSYGRRRSRSSRRGRRPSRGSRARSPGSPASGRSASTTPTARSASRRCSSAQGTARCSRFP
jgi:hypothetical protein